MRNNSSSFHSLKLLRRYPQKTRVLIADAHPIERLGLRTILENSEDICIVAEVSNGSEVLPLIERQKPDLLILEAELPGLAEGEIVKQFIARQLPVPVLGFGATSAPNLYALLQSGAAGYLTKDEMPEVIVAAVRGIAHGEDGWLSRQAVVQFIRIQANQEEARSQLTRRQREVLDLVADGQTNQQIAHALGNQCQNR